MSPWVEAYASGSPKRPTSDCGTSLPETLTSAVRESSMPESLGVPLHTRMISGAAILVLCNAAQAACPEHVTVALDVGGSTLCVFAEEPELSKQQRLWRPWIERSARIVADYYGRFPAPLVIVRLQTMDGGGVGGGRTTNDSGLMIRVRIGREASSAALQ